MNKQNKKLSKKLQSLVSWSVNILGEAIKKEYGVKTFNRIEKLRLSMKGLRKSETNTLYKTLLKEKKKLSKLSTIELDEITLSYTFMLELMNRCENAYRSFQQGQKKKPLSKERPLAIIMVLTAHPTEARSPELLELFRTIQELLIKSLEEDTKKYEDNIFHLLLVGLKISLARRKKPTVIDEALNIYSYILRKDILDRLINFASIGVNLRFRAWVGGDKDGHPGVDEKTMLKSFNISRLMLLDFLDNKLNQIASTAKLIPDEQMKDIITSIKMIKSEIKTLKKISKDDGMLITTFRKSIKTLINNYQRCFHIKSPQLKEIVHLLEIFPALVVPLEIREDSEVVKAALKSPRPLAIEKMLISLRDISNGFDSKCYVRGFILSMVESHLDIINGYKLVQKTFKNYGIPVIPLFENEKALTNAKDILNNLFESKKSIPRHHIAKWLGYYEVMVGYSDSSKENGVFPSRLMISNALAIIEKTLKSYKLTPVFFHGSGGSIERGGGSIKNQTGWWPKSALNVYKATIQGEMVARTFNNEKILSSFVSRIVEQLNIVKKVKNKKVNNFVLQEFSDLVRHHYVTTVQNDDFFKIIDAATPYNFLNHLKIGSRPSKRTTGGDSRKLRAIPWILCWTQTRVLFPTWWGTGMAWKELSTTKKKTFKREYMTNPLVSSFMSALGFTLAKVELGVWKIYLHESGLDPKLVEEIYTKFEKEYKSARAFFTAVTGKKELLWHRPWLQQSIDYRSSMIHPLNLIQLESLKRGELDLLIDTVTGISCGMLTTG
ncbi:MAG: phosphoenolpyruvate carboxylase [Epsilonproteobacteria bacterium]|nr:MAG: phosphoenolpyruvate carboxylase [Campylobacterota bacterium]